MSSSIYNNCTEVTPSCPVEGTIYGYYPNLGANVFFFAGYSFALASGTFMEAIGFIFIGCDTFSNLLQSAGGGVASSNDPSLANTGNKIMIGGIAFQVVTMGVCGVLAVDFALRYRKSRMAADSNWSWKQGPISRRTVLCATLALAYTLILIRCIYRIPEMATGWGGKLMRHEGEFMGLDSLMVALGVVALTVNYPGYIFPGMMNATDKPEEPTKNKMGHERWRVSSDTGDSYLMDTRNPVESS